MAMFSLECQRDLSKFHNGFSSYNTAVPLRDGWITQFIWSEQ